MLNIEQVFWAAQAATLARVSYWLMDDGHILGWYGSWLRRKQWAWPDYITKPLGLCGRCFSGQVGFWSAVLLGLEPVQIILFAAATILISEIIQKNTAP